MKIISTFKFDSFTLLRDIVFVQLVIAAIITEPWLILYSVPSSHTNDASLFNSLEGIS